MRNFQILILFNSLITYQLITLPEDCENNFNDVLMKCEGEEKYYDLFGNLADEEHIYPSGEQITNSFIENFKEGKEGIIESYNKETLDFPIKNYLDNLQSTLNNVDAKSNYEIIKLAAGASLTDDSSLKMDYKEEDPEELNFKVSFYRDKKGENKEMDVLNIYMAKYHINGTLVGFNFTYDELLMCSHKREDKLNFLKFGNNINMTCYIDLSQFLNRRKQMYFYKFFLFNNITNSDNPEAIPIPILIENINDLNGKKSELEDNNKQKIKLNQNIFVEKMFLFDHFSGLSDLSFNNPPQYITYAQKIQFIVKLNSNNSIKRPYIKVFYSTRSRDDIDQFPNAYIEFISEYRQDINKFMTTMLVLLIVIIVVVIILAIYRMYIWKKLNPPEIIQEHYVLTFIITLFFKLCKFFGFIMFFAMFIMTGYWYIFYKLQYKVYLLLPPLTDYDEYYKKFDIVFYISCALYIIYMFYRLYRQLSFDIFFIDWEHEKKIFKNNVTAYNEMGSRYSRYKGAWRLLHVANQFHSIQCLRHVSLYFCFCWVVLFYYRVDWNKFELHVPRTSQIDYAEENYILRMFLSTFILLVSGAGQFLIRFCISPWIPYKSVEFMDLCSVANISVFILNEKLQGYYVHGKSSFDRDTNFEELYRHLDEEKDPKELNKGRGVNGEEEQENEMFISIKMRQIYDGLFLIQNETLIAQNQKKDEKTNQRRLWKVHQFLESIGQNINVLSNFMNNQLKTQIENVENAKLILDRSCFQRILDIPTPNVENTDKEKERILLLKGSHKSFKDVLFSGMEFEWFIMDLYFFQMFMIALKNMEIAMFLTFVCDQILYLVRVFIGEKNLSKKAVIDNRFIS